MPIAKRETVKCNWCGQTMPVSEVMVKKVKNDYGSVTERRCPKCGKILAAYLEEEGEFLTKMRTF